MFCLHRLVVFCLLIFVHGEYQPDWLSLDTRPIPTWFDDSKFGIFCVWGLYSVPAFENEWFWWYWQGEKRPEYVGFMKDNYKPGFAYADFSTEFTGEFFDSDKIAKIVEKSGAKYFVLTSKHHEGYTMYKSNYSWNWNAVETGPHRDLVAELATAIRKTGVRFGLYFSLFAWFHPLYLRDKATTFKSQEYPAAVSLPQLKEIVNAYKPEVIWSDGDWEASYQYWNSTDFLAWLYNDSPVKDTVVVNDRWGIGATCKHGDYYTCSDKFNPGHLMSHKWENCMTIDRYSWGFRRTARYEDFLSIQELIATLASTISCGGNLLMNVGPTHDGRIVPIFEERLTQMGQYVKTNDEAIFGTKPWIYQNDTKTPDIWYVSRLKNDSGFDPRRLYNPQISDNTIVYAYVLKWPGAGVLTLAATKGTKDTKVSMLGYSGPFRFAVNPSGSISVDFTKIQWTQLPNTWSWVLKLENLDNDSHKPNLYEAAQFAVIDEKRRKAMEAYGNFEY